MAYSRGFLKDRIKVLNRTTSSNGKFGREGGSFSSSGEIWAKVSWSRGMKALSEGAIDAYDYYIIRCDCHSFLKRESRLEFNGQTFQIENFREEKSKNEVQILCVELQK